VTCSSPIPIPRRPLPSRAISAQAGDQLAVGMALQVVMLVALAAGVGLHAVGWAWGLGFGVATRALLATGLRRSRRFALGPADQVTLARTVLVGGVTALAADGWTRPVPVTVLVGLTGAALLLDGVDGRVARRTGTASAFGARFDMEVDAFLILVLSVALVRPVGVWVVAIGAMRYAFVLAGIALPWLTASLPARFARKVVAAVQGVVLVVAVADVLPPAVTRAGVLFALVALCWSFGRDVIWLAHSHSRTRIRPGSRPESRSGSRSEHAHDHDLPLRSTPQTPVIMQLHRDHATSR